MKTSITILNKLKKSDSTTKLDVWFKTVIPDVEYKEDLKTAVTETNIVAGATFDLLIPFNNGYLPYYLWKDLEDKSQSYTLSLGDYFIIGEVDDIVTPNTLPAIRSKYTGYMGEIRGFTEGEKTPFTNYRFKVIGV